MMLQKGQGGKGWHRCFCASDESPGPFDPQQQMLPGGKEKMSPASLLLAPLVTLWPSVVQGLPKLPGAPTPSDLIAPSSRSPALRQDLLSRLQALPALLSDRLKPTLMPSFFTLKAIQHHNQIISNPLLCGTKLPVLFAPSTFSKCTMEASFLEMYICFLSYIPHGNVIPYPGLPGLLLHLCMLEMRVPPAAAVPESLLEHLWNCSSQQKATGSFRD